MRPKKLVRSRIAERLKDECELIEDQDELNLLYEKKIKEELEEIKNSGYKDITEFIDLIQVSLSFAKMNGFSTEEIQHALLQKSLEKGTFDRRALINLNPNNPSNKIYFES